MTTYYAVGATYDGVTDSLATSTGGSATVAAVTSADTIIFDGDSIALAFTADPACALINIEAAFAHTITLSHAISAGEVEMAATSGTLTTAGHLITLTGTSGTVFSYTAGTTDTLYLSVSDTGSSSKTLALGTGTYNLSIASGGTGAVILDGTAVNFAGFTVAGSSTKTIEFQEGQTFKFSGNVTFNTGQLVTLKSTVSAEAATFNLEAVWNTNYVSVQDLNVVGEDPGAVGYYGVIGTNASGWVLVDSPLSIPLFPPTTPGAAQFAALVGKSLG
jgi:hypothetical protein